MTPYREPPSPYGWRLSLLLAWGEHEQARALLEAVNRVARAFGDEPYSMPSPAGDTEGLVWCRADVPYTRMRRDVDPHTGRDRIAA